MLINEVFVCSKPEEEQPHLSSFVWIAVEIAEVLQTLVHIFESKVISLEMCRNVANCAYPDLCVADFLSSLAATVLYLSSQLFSPLLPPKLLSVFLVFACFFGGKSFWP